MSGDDADTGERFQGRVRVALNRLACEDPQLLAVLAAQVRADRDDPAWSTERREWVAEARRRLLGRIAEAAGRVR